MTRVRESGIGRVLSFWRSRIYAALALGVFVLIYALGFATRRGLVDGFGHAIGTDLLTMRVAAEMVRDGDGDHLYDFARQAARQEAALGPGSPKGVNPFVYPPFVALAYRPLAALPHLVAFALWTVVGVGCLTGAVLLTARNAPRIRGHPGGIVLLALSFTPVLEGLAAGSNSIVSLPIFAATLVALRSEREILAGGLLGLQTFRPQLLLATLVLLAWKRRWRVIGGFAAVASVLVALAVVFVARRSMLDWAELFPLLSRMMFEPGMPTPLFSSVHALFLLPLGPQHLALGLAAGSAAAATLLGLLLTLWAGPWRPADADFGLRFAALLVVTPLISPYLQLHDFAILVLAAMLLVEATLGRSSGSGMDQVRLFLAFPWIACMVAPAIAARVVPVPLAPIGALVLGWAVIGELRSASER